MPVYEAFCDSCRNLQTYIRKVDDRDKTPVCCDVPTRKVILTVPMGFVQVDVCYDSPIDGRPITTRQARIEDMKRSGSRPWEGMKDERAEAARRVAYSDMESDKALDKAIDQSMMQISETSRRALLEG